MTRRVRQAGLSLLFALLSNAAAEACEPSRIAALVAALDTALDDHAAETRFAAATALGTCGTAAVPALVVASDAAPAGVRQGAVRALGWIAAAGSDGRTAVLSVLPALTARLADPEPLVREAAAEALGRCGPPASAAVPALVAAFADEDPYLGGAAAVALGRIGAASVPALGEALADPREGVRQSAAIALGRLGSRAAPAVAALARTLADGSAVVRGMAATALGEIGPPAGEVLPSLVAALSDPDEAVRRAVRTAIGRISPSWHARPPGRDEVVATIERLVPQLMAEHHVPGVAIALIDEGRVAWQKSFGVRDVASGAPVERETLFEAASMSKPVFAMIAMRLVERGALPLDRPLVELSRERAVPDLPERRRITARMTLAHTSGLPNWRPGDEEREGPLPLLFAPGSRFSYSGEGIFYLQRVVEERTGLPLDLLARRELFTPLGLTGSSFVWNETVEARLASGHTAEGAFLTRSRYTHPNAAYTLYTSAEEYARLLVAMLESAESGTPLLERRTAREMLRGQVELDARDPIERPGAAQGTAVAWGLGWSLNRTAGGTIYHHSGANRTGFRSFSQFSPPRRSGLVVLTNSLGGGELWTRLVAAVGDL
ncbi:MAG: serine hydrolase [Holophagales bacterium]|nr:MAG: serine hydrolase [Holophagales bacterium]